MPLRAVKFLHESYGQGNAGMQALEEVRFGQVVRSKSGEGYQVIRPWDGSSVFVADLKQSRNRTRLQYNRERNIVRSCNGNDF